MKYPNDRHIELNEEWKVGDIVQIRPEHDELFGGCLMVVDEIKSWGAQGYFKIPGKGLAYYRVKFQDAIRVGKAEWLVVLAENEE